MKILIVSVNREREPYPVAPLGAAYVAGALRREGHEARILDLCFEEDADQAVRAAISAFRPDLIGLSIRNIDNLTYGKSINYMPAIRQLMNTIRHAADVPVVAGGSGFSIFPEPVLRYLGLELGIVGEGELAFCLLAGAYEKGGSFDSVPNLCMVRDDRFIPAKVGCGSFSDTPERMLLDNPKYLMLGGMGNIQTKRGCPFTCTYCTYPSIEGRELRLRDAGEVVDELKAMRSQHGIDYAFFVDDIFNFPEEHAAGICEAMIRDEVKMDWTCFATPRGMTPGLAGLMKKAGCKGVEFGSDAGDGETLEAFGKQFTPDDIAHAAECCSRVDLPQAHYIILGGPGERDATLRRTFSLFDRIRPTAVIALTGVRIYPNTPLQLRAVDEGVIAAGDGLFEPVFYLSPEIEAHALSPVVAEHAGGRSNWIVPSLDIRCNPEMLALLRQRGRKGPLWDLL